MILNLKKLLIKTLENKMSANSQYSMRSFARDIGIGKSSLSEYLSSNSKLSKKNLEKVVSYFKFSQEDQDLLMKYHDSPEDDVFFDQLTVEQFDDIASCEHYAILSLARIPNFPFDENKIASKLKISREKIIDCLKTLQYYNLIFDDYGILKRTQKQLTTSNDLPSKSIQKYHSSNILKIRDALTEVSVELREIASTTFLMNIDKVEEIKKDLRIIRRKLVSQFQDENSDSEIFLLNFSLIPLSFKEEIK